MRHHHHVRRRPRRLAVLGGLAAVLAACTSTVAGVPADQPPTATARPGPALAGDQEERAWAFAVDRAVDPCALQNPAAAEKVTGQVRLSVMPKSDLNSCEVSLAPQGS